MLARVRAGKEVVIPQANAKVTDGRLTDADILAFAEEEIVPFLDSLG